jgi:hypothetical protein
MTKGFNKALITEKLQWTKLFSKNERPCIFLSQKKEDKPACREIAKYLKNAEIDIFFDEEDDELQVAVTANNPKDVTERIKAGIRECSHMLCIVSLKTYGSMWVPFEIGYANAAIVDKATLLNSADRRIKITTLTLKDIAEKNLPEYLQITNIIKGSKSFKNYISQISNKLEQRLLNENLIKAYSQTSHPLDNYLKYDL